MKIKIICVGKLKEQYLVDGIKEYMKRISAYADIEVIEVPDERIPDRASLAEEMMVKVKEGRKILDKVKQDDYMILLDVNSRQMDSIEFSRKIEDCMINGKSTIDFVIGFFTYLLTISIIEISILGSLASVLFWQTVHPASVSHLKEQ